MNLGGNQINDDEQANCKALPQNNHHLSQVKDQAMGEESCPTDLNLEQQN